MWLRQVCNETRVTFIHRGLYIFLVGYDIEFIIENITSRNDSEQVNFPPCL